MFQDLRGLESVNQSRLTAGSSVLDNAMEEDGLVWQTESIKNNNNKLQSLNSIYPWHVVVVREVGVKPNPVMSVGNVTGVSSHLHRVARTVNVEK